MFQPTDDLDRVVLIAFSNDNKNIGLGGFADGGRAHVKTLQHAKTPCLADGAPPTKTSLQSNKCFLQADSGGESLINGCDI